MKENQARSELVMKTNVSAQNVQLFVTTLAVKFDLLETTCSAADVATDGESY